MYRIIYSLKLEFYPSERGEYVELIVPLDANGCSKNVKPEPPKTQAIDIRQDEFVWLKSQRFLVKRISAHG